MNKPDIDFDLATETFIVQGVKYKAIKDGEKPPIVDAIADAEEEYEKALTEAREGKIMESQRRKVHISTSKKILEAGIADFDWDAANKTHGAAMLGLFADEVYRFFVVSGGVAGLKHLSRLYGLNTKNTSDSTTQTQSTE